MFLCPYLIIMLAQRGQIAFLARSNDIVLLLLATGLIRLIVTFPCYVNSALSLQLIDRNESSLPLKDLQLKPAMT